MPSNRPSLSLSASSALIRPSPSESSSQSGSLPSLTPSLSLSASSGSVPASFSSPSLSPSLSLSTMTSVGGEPAALPLPSVGYACDGLPGCGLEAVMIAWLEMSPSVVALTVTRNLTVVLALIASVPPAVAFAPVPTRTLTVLDAAVYSPWSSPAASVFVPVSGPAEIWIDPGT